MFKFHKPSYHIFSLNFWPNILAFFDLPLQAVTKTNSYQVHKLRLKNVITITVKKLSDMNLLNKISS
jgi:hypothetical protein